MKLWWAVVPAMLVLFALLGYGLTSDPKHIPSPLVGKAFPPLPGNDLNGNAVTLGDIKGRPTIVNVWASWCVSCRAEHRVLVRGAKVYSNKIDLIGVNYKDELRDAQAWLNRFGDPYLWSYQDISGRVGIELGVYGVPETFFINAQGMIVKKIAGPLTDESLREGVELITRSDVATAGE